MCFTLSMQGSKGSGLQIAWLKTGMERAGENWGEIDLKPKVEPRSHDYWIEVYIPENNVKW